MLTKEKELDPDLTNEVGGDKTPNAPNESGNKLQTDGSGRLSFLGARPRIPPLPDSPEPPDLSKPEEHQLVAEIPCGIKDSPVNDVEQDPLPPQVNSRPTFSPTANSPTAVPFTNRQNPPFLSAESRFRPRMPFSTKTRPRSTEFRSSEFRPLYLVARHTPRHEPSIENYYSLPSSHSTTRTSSIQDPEEFDLERGPNQIDALDLVDPIMTPHSERRGLVIDTLHSLQGLDLLDSAQPTPTAHSFQAVGQRDASPQAKTMQDLKSALISIPLLLPPHYANSNHDPSSSSQHRSQELVRDRNDFSSDHGWKNVFPEYPFQLTEDLPPLPSSRTSSSESVSEPNSLETIIQPMIHPKHEFELPDDLPPLPGSRASSSDLDDILDEPNKSPQSSLCSTKNDFEQSKDFSDLSSIRPLSPDPCLEPAEQRFLSLSKHEFVTPEDLLSMPSSRVSSPEPGDQSEKTKSAPQSTRDVRIPGDLPPLPRSRTPTPDLDAQVGQSISMPQLIRVFGSPRNLPTLPSSRVLSPDNDIKPAPEPETITRPVYSFQPPEDLPALPSSRASSPDLDAELGDGVLVCQPVNEFEHFEHLPALPSSRASSTVADAKSNLELERKASFQPGYGLERSENLPPLPCSCASSPDFHTGLNAEPTISPQSTFKFKRSEDLPALPSSRASSPDAESKYNLELKTKTSPLPVYDIESSKHLPPLPSSRASSPDFDTDFNAEPAISPQPTLEFKRSEDLPALPGSRASSPDAEARSNLELETKTSPQPVYDLERSENLPPLPSSRASSPDFDTDFNAEPAISPQSTLEFKRSEDLPALPSSRASSPDSEARSNLEHETKTSQPVYGLESSEHLPPLPSSRPASPDSDTDFNAEPIISPQSIFEFKRSEDLPTLPSRRASSPDAEAKSNLELERKTSQPVYGLEPSEHPPPLLSSRASSPDIDTDFKDETILSPQSKFEFQRLDDLPPLPSSPASSPDADFFHDVETKILLEPTLEFPSSEDLPALPSSRASSPDAETFHEMETEVPLEPTLESDGSKYLPPLPVSYASSLETYDTLDIKTKTLLEPTFDFQRPENPIKLPSSRTSTPESDIYHHVEKKIPLQPMNLILSFSDLSALPFSHASQKNSSDETEGVSNKSGSKVMTQEKSITNLGGDLDSNEITGAINAEIAKPSKAKIEMTLQSPDLLTSKGNSLDNAKESEFSLQRQPDAENAGTLSTLEKGSDIESTLRVQESLSSGTLAKGMTGDEVAAVMAVVAEGGTNTHDKRPTTNSKKARRNQKKAKQEDRPQASIRKASDRASVQPQEGVEVDLSSQSFASKDPNMASGESSSEATDLFIQILGTQLVENIQIEENAPPIKKGKKGKKNKKQAIQTSPSLKSLVANDSSTKASPQAIRPAVLAPIAGESDMEGAQMGGSSVETVDQKSPKATSRSETPPVAIALPIDNDFEFLEALPRSPSVRPIIRSSLPDSFSGTTASHVDDHQKTVLEAERPPEAVQLPSDTDLELLAPTQYLEATDGGRCQSKEPENNEAHEPYAMVAELQNSASGPAIVPKLLESTAGDDLDQVEASSQNALLKKADESSQEQAQVKDSQSEIPNSPITEPLKPDLEPNIAAQFIALPPNDDLDLLEASLPKPSTEIMYAEWLEQPEPLIYESPESAPSHEIIPRAGALPDSEDLGSQKSSSQSSSVESTEQRSPWPGLGEFKRPGEVGSSTQLSKEASVLAPEFTALPSETNPGLLGYLPQMMSVEVPQLNTQLDESKGDAEASSSKLPETPIIPAKDITSTANSDLDFLEDLPSQPKESIGISNPAGEPIAKLPKDIYKIQSYPETIALPVDDDPDLLDALPPSPPTDSQSKSINELTLRSPTQILRPNVTSEIFVLPAAKDFRYLRAPPASSIAGPMPTIPEEILEHGVAPESVKLPSDDDLELAEELSSSPLADPMDSQLEAFQEPNFHSSRDSDEPEVTPHIIADEKLDLPDVLSNPETIELPDDEDLDLLEALPPSPYSYTRQVSHVGSITLPETLPLSPPVEHISRSPKVLLKLKVNPEISNIPADEDFDSRRAIPPSSPVDSSVNSVNEQNFRLTENFLTSEMTPDIIALPADKDFDLLEALPGNMWAGSQQSPVKEARLTPLIHTPEAKDVTQGIRADHDLAEALPPSILDERMEYQADQHEEFPPRSMKESSEPKVTPQAVELPYDDDLDLLEALPPSPPTSPTPELESRVRLPSSPSDGSKEHHVEQIDERTTKGRESGRQTPQSPLSRLVKSKDHFKPTQEPTSTSPVLEVNPEATDLPVSDNLDSLNTLPPSLLTNLTEHQTWSLEETIPIPPEITPSIFACTDGDFGLLKPRPEILFADHQTRSMKEPIMNSPKRARSIVDGGPCLQEPRPEIPSPGHQIGSLEDPIPELLELAPSTVACVDGDLGVLEARPEILSVDQSSQQTDILDERISKWQNELVAESQLPPESIELPADEDRNILADLAPSSDKSIISDGVELKLLEQAPQPEEASRHALKPLNEPDSQILPEDLPLPADDGLESLETLPESPLPEFQVVPEDFPLPTDGIIGLLEELPKSPLSARVVPQDFPLPTVDDFDLLKALTEPQVSPKDFPLPMGDDLDLLEKLPESPLSKSRVVPKDLPLPTDDIDLLGILSKSPLPESQVVPEDFPLPTDDDLDLLEGLPESPFSESRVAPEEFPSPADNELDVLEALPTGPLFESQVAPRDFPLSTDDDLDRLGALPETPLPELSNKDSDRLEAQHLEAKEQDQDSHHNLIIPDLPEPEGAPENLHLPANDHLDLEYSPQSPLARSIYPDNKDIAPLVIEGLLKEEVKGEVVEFERAPVNDKGDTDKVNGEVGKDAHSVAELGMGGASLETTGIIQDDVVHTGPSLGKNANKNKKNKKDRKSAVNPIFAPLELQIKPISVASGSQFIEDIASEPKKDTSATELEEGKDGVVRQFVADADEELGSGKNNGKKGKKSKSRATTSIVETSIPPSSLPLELPKKSAGDTVFEVLMQDKTKEVTSEDQEILGNDGDISKEGKKKKKKGKKNQEESSKSGLILEEVELPKASVATEGSKETTESSEKLVPDAEVEGSQGQETIDDEWLNEYNKRGKQRKKAEDNTPPPGDSTDLIEPPSSKTMKRDLDFEDSQAQAVTEDERQKGPKKTVKKGNKSKGKKSKPSITSPGVPLMTSPAYPIDESSSTDVAQIKAFELSLNLPADTKDETSKIYEAGMNQISSFEDTETSELQPGQLESEEIVSEGALQDPQVEDELSERNRKKARKEKKQRSKISDTYGEGSDSEKVESSHALSEPMPEMVDQLVETCDKEAVEEPRQDHGLTKTMGHKLEYVEPRQEIPESEQVEPGHLETRLIDLEEPQPAQSHSVYIEPNQTESSFQAGKSVEANASEPKDPASGQPKSHPMEENPSESSLKLEFEPIEKENFTFSATSSVQENGKSTPTPQESESPECIPGEVAAPVENMIRKNPSSIVDPELPLHLQVVEHSPTRDKNLATTGRKQPTSDAENKLLDSQKNLPLILEPATLTQLPPSTDQHPLVLEDSPFPATESSFTKTPEKLQSTVKQPSVREDGPNIGTPSSENPSVTISNTTTLRPLSSDTYPLPTEKLSTIDRSDKSLDLQEESADIGSHLSAKSFVAAKEVPVIKVPSVDELPATAKELAAFESYQSPHHAKEPPVKSLDVFSANKSVVGIEEPFIRDVAAQDKLLPAVEDISAMEVPSSDKALVTLEEPAIIDAPSLNESLIHAEDSSVTDSGLLKKSAAPVQELPVIEAPMSARSSPTMGGYSIATVEEPPVLNVLPSVAKSQLSHTETLSLGHDNHTSSVNEPPLTIQMELISEENIHKHPSTVENLTPTSVRDIKRSAVIDNPPNACEDYLLSNANKLSEDILPQDDFASAKEGKEGKKSKETVTTEQELTVSDGSSAEIKQETESQQPDENSLILENIIAVPKANKSKGKMALKAQEQEDELDLPDQVPIASEEILGLNLKAEPDQFGDDFTSSAALEKQDHKSVPLEEDLIAPIKRSKKGKKGTKARKQVDDDLAQPEGDPTTPEDPSAVLEKQNDELNQPEDDAITPAGLSAVLKKQGQMDESISPGKNTKKGRKGSKSRKQRDVDELNQPEVVPISPQDPLTGLEGQEVELDIIEENPFITKDLSGVSEKQAELDGSATPLKKAKKFKESKKARKREADRIDQPEDSSAALDEPHPEEDSITPEDLPAVFEKQEDALRAKEDPILPEEISNISNKQEDELKTKEGTIVPEECLPGLSLEGLSALSNKREVGGDEDLIAPVPATPEDLSAAPEEQEDELDELDEEPIENAKKSKRSKKGSKARKREVDEPEQQEDISAVSEKQYQVDGHIGPDRVAPDKFSALPAIQDRIEETSIALDPITTEDFSSTVPESQVDEPEQLEDDNIAPNYSYAVKKAKKGKKGKKQEIFNELDQPDENLITSKVRSVALEKQEAEPDQFGKKTRKGKKVKSKRQRFHDLPEEDPLDPEDFSAPELKQADELDQPEEYPVISGGLSAIHTKQIGPVNQPEEDQVIPEDFSTINTKQINLLDQSEDPIVSENPSALIVDRLDQTQEDIIILEELSAMTKGKLDQREQESIHPEGLSVVPTTTTTTTTTAIDKNIYDPASSENLATGSKSKKGQKGKKAKMPRFDKLDQHKEPVATEDIDTTLLRQEDELDQPKEPIAPKYIGALLKQEDEFNRSAQESILSEGLASVVTIEKGKKGKNAKMQDKHGIEEPKEDFTASEYSAAVIEALQHEDPTTTEKNDAGSIQSEAEVFDRVDGEPVAVKSPTVPERKKSKKGKKSKQENLESAEHEPIASEDTFLPLEDDELGQPGQKDIASAHTVAEPKAKKSQKGKKEKHVDRLGPSDQTILAPEAASASQDKLLDRPEQSTIASEESSVPQELSAEIPLKNKSKKSKEPRSYESLVRPDKEPITPKENIASLGNIPDVPTSKQVGQDDESIQRSLNVLGPEPSDEASALQEKFSEIAIAKSKSDRKSKEESQTGARSISEEIIATAAGAGVSELPPNDTRDLALGPISQQLSDNISKPQAEPQYEETKEAETGQQNSNMTPNPTVPTLESRRNETPVAEESRMDNSLGIQVEEATLQEYLIKPQAEREFEDAGSRGKDNSLLIEGYRETIQSELSHGTPRDQREKVAVQGMPTTAALDSMPSDVTVQPQNQFPLAELADRDVDHTYPAKILSSYDANPFIDLGKGGDPRRIPEASQTAHPADRDVQLPTPSLEADAAEPHESKRLVEAERPKSSGLTIVSSDTDLNRHTYSEDLIEPEKSVPELLPVDPASKKSTPVEELSAPEWGLKPAKKRKKKESKKKTLGSDSLNAEEIFERGTAEGSEGATLAGDLNLKLNKEIEEDLPEISLTGADVEKSTPIGELGLPEWGLKPAKKGKRERKSKKKNLDSDSINTDEIPERESADASERAALAGDLDLKFAEEFREDMPEISLTKADVENFPHEELRDPSWDNKPVKKSKKEKKSKTEAVHSDFLRTRENLGEGPAKFSEKAALDSHMDSKPDEGLTVPELDVPELPLTDTDAAEEFSVPEAGLKSTKIKKEKKSKTKAWNTDSMITGEILGQVPGDIPEDLARDSDLKPSELAGPEQDMPELQQIENNAKESIPVEDSAIIELKPRPSKKGKKDKKSKSRFMASNSLATEESLDSAASKIPAIEAPTEQNLPELLSTEESIPKVDSTRAESGFSLPKKSKNDKKSKDRAIASGSLIPETTEFPKKYPKEHVFREISNADKSISIEDSIIPESRPLPFERSKKEKKSKNKDTVNNILVTQETPEPAATEMTAEIPEEQIVPQFSSTEKSRKSQKAGKQNLDIGYGMPFAVGDDIERRPGEAPLDIPAEPIILEHEPSTKRMKSKQSKKQGFELGSNIHPLDTELVLQNSQQATEANRSVSSADHVDKEDSRPIDRTHNETERHQTLIPERKISQDDREQTYEPSPVHTHNEIGADNTSVKMVDFTSEAPTPGGSTPGESTPGESTPAESVTRDSIAPDYPHVNEILPVQHDIQDHHSQGTNARALQKQYPDFVQEESQPHFEDEKPLSGREFEAQELSQNLADRATENTFNISVEVDSSYGVSISTPSSKQKRSLTVSTPARNDEEAFPNNTRGIQSLQTEGQPFRGPGEPSPVSPTTKERSSALFQSSPSTREDLVNRRPEPESPLHDPAEIKDVEYGSRDLPDWIQPGGFSINKSRTTAQPPIDLNTSITDGKMGPSDSRGPGSPVCPVSPASFREERTPSRSPFVSDISDTPRLNTIVEYSPEESPLHEKSRSVSDVGSPERGVKFRRRSAVPQQSSQVRMRSPLNPENTARLTAPFEDLPYRLSWPPVDEDHHTVDLERSGSRNTSVSKQSERRSPSGASVGSVESINAIIKTSDAKSSGTPPLRRTDRSVSGDLREAHKKGGAKKLAKRKEAEGQLDITIPSSSTYDPTKDKGKGRVDDMAAVYVSTTFDFHIIYQNHRKLMRS